MAIKTAAELKAYFNTGDKPTEAQFGDLIDTMLSNLSAQPKIYKIKVTQSGASAPAITEFINTTGYEAVSSRTGAGDYEIDLGEAIDYDKTHFQFSGSFIDNENYIRAVLTEKFGGNGVIVIRTDFCNTVDGGDEFVHTLTDGVIDGNKNALFITITVLP